MRARRLTIAAASCLLITARGWAAPQTTVTEPFDGTIDQASWRAGPDDQIVAGGGHPGAFLEDFQIDLAVPRISTVDALAASFLGNYRALGVTSEGIDAQILDVGISVDGRPVTLLLYSDMGTPADTTDDCEVATTSTKNLPRPGGGWRAFDFKIPSKSTTLPMGWQTVGACAGLSGDAAWDYVIQHVQRASFDFGEPGFFYFFQVWTIGYDNARISMTR